MSEDKISFKEFKTVDLRVARILEAERVEGTDKLMRLQIDLGEEENRQIIAGIATRYEADDLPGRLIVVVANLEPATIRGVESNGMLLAANVGGRPELVGFDTDVEPGTPIT